VAESPEPAPADAGSAEAPRSLKARLAAIRDDCDAIQKSNIQKEKDGKKWTERGHIVEAILSEWRPLLAKHGVVMTPNLVERTYSGNRCDVLVDFTFERTDGDEEARTIRWAGAGTDNGDKAFAKAGTNALKEMIKKAFLVTDRDDAKEEEDKVEHQPEGQAGRAQVEKAKDVAARALQQWAVTFKAALEGASTVKEIDRLRQESADQLADENTPPVTRQFFFELIQKRKAELAGK
jgi:hypothetical protein